jgi:hypothetical protein
MLVFRWDHATILVWSASSNRHNAGHDRIAGWLDEDEHGYHFSYDPAYLAAS